MANCSIDRSVSCVGTRAQSPFASFSDMSRRTTTFQIRFLNDEQHRLTLDVVEWRLEIKLALPQAPVVFEVLNLMYIVNGQPSASGIFLPADDTDRHPEIGCGV